MNKRHYPLHAARRIAAWLLFVFMAIAPMLASTEGSLGADGQNGKKDNPFTIKNAKELTYLAEVVNSGKEKIQLTDGDSVSIAKGFKGLYIQLAANIDLNGENWMPIGIIGNPFRGNFDGKGYCVSGLTVVIEGEAGLFGYAMSGTIQNLGVKVHAKGIKASGEEGTAGGIAGIATGATIRNCYVEGPGLVEAEGTRSSYAGGIAGNAYIISHCYATVDVKVSEGASECCAGGIAGYANELSYTYATGNVEASGDNGCAGGICGHSGGALLHNLALNKEVKGGSENVHRVVGGMQGGLPSSNYASPDMYVKGQLVSSTDANGKDGSEAGIDLTYYAQNGGVPNEWSSDAWIFDSKGNILPQLQMVTGANGALSYSEWNTNSPQPKLPAANYLPAIKIKEGGDGTSWENAIEISNSSELAYLARMVNANKDLTVGSKTIKNNGNGFSGKHFILTDNIDLSAYNWTPIGNRYLTPFRGHFDGKGYVVNGLKIDINDPSGNDVYAGLFGHTSSGEIRNLGVRLAKEGIKVESNNGAYVGGIVGDANNATIRNCYVDAEEDGKIIIVKAEVGQSGGIAGRLIGNGTITHCYSTVDIEAKIVVSAGKDSPLNIGGIAGFIGSGTISHCYATGSVIGKGEVEEVGGIAANLSVGGICGRNYGTVKNNLALNKELRGKTDKGQCYVNRIVGESATTTNNYANPEMLVNGQKVSDGAANNEDGANTWLDKFEDHLKGLLGSNEWEAAWVWTAGQLPQLKMVTDENAPAYSDEAMPDQKDHLVSDYLPHSPWSENVATAIENADENDGLTPEKAILIKDAAELAYFAQQVNAGGIELELTNGEDINNNPEKKGFSGYYFALSANIDLLAGEWTPIGNSYDNPFRGHFDGKGYLVKGLKIKMDVTDADEGLTFAGLFGYVVNGTLQNIGVELADEGIEVSAENGPVFAGGIAGRIDASESGTAILRHCYVTGPTEAKLKMTGANAKATGANIQITGAGADAYAGGITGRGFKEGGSLTLTHCYATVDVEAIATGSSYAGGIAGGSDEASYCYATGNVLANNFAGGICGNGTVSNSLALNPHSHNGADTWLDTFKNDLLNAPGGEGWSDDKGWKWPADANSTLLPKLKVAVIKASSEITSYSDWPGKPVQPSIDAALYLKECPYPRLHIQSPTGATLTVTDAADTNNTPIADNTQVRPGTTLKLSHTITKEGYSFNHYLRGTSANEIDQKIEGETYVMPDQDVWISASVSYTKPDPEPVNPPPTPTFFTVTLPQVEGVSTDPGAGNYKVEHWDNFRFYLTLDPAYSDSQPVVTTSRGETIQPRTSDGAYVVRYVRADIDIYISGVQLNDPTANDAIDAAPADIRAEGHTLFITVPRATEALLCDLSGRLLQRLSLVAGQNRVDDLRRGLYIVKLSGEEGVKVIIK